MKEHDKAKSHQRLRGEWLSSVVRRSFAAYRKMVDQKVALRVNFINQAKNRERGHKEFQKDFS